MDEFEYLKRIRDLAPGIAERAESAEDLRRIPEDTMRELRQSGLMKALQPRRWGGFELDPRVV